MKPADLRPGHRIAHTVRGMTGPITVHAQPYDDTADAEREGCPELGRVYVDVVVADASYASSKWDPGDLPAGCGADQFQWLGLNPLRYRLTYLPDTDFDVEQP